MITLALLAALALSAKGEIYRCVGADGNVGFHDQPCKGRNTLLLGKKSDSPQADLRRLRQSLAQLERSQPAPRAPASTPAVLPSQLQWRTRGAVNEPVLAACSVRFFHCAEGNAPRMDRCVAAITRCGTSGRANCCPEECVRRYGDLRRNGLQPAPAVRNALLDERYGSCTAN